jgi:hypothetical protein
MKKLLVIWCIIVMLLQSCSQLGANDNSQVVNNCIPPLTTFAFSINQSPHTAFLP